MKRLRLAAWTMLLIASGALVGCHRNQHQGPHYSGWGGCYSQMESGADGIPMVPPGEGGHPVWSQPSHGAGVR